MRRTAKSRVAGANQKVNSHLKESALFAVEIVFPCDHGQKCTAVHSVLLDNARNARFTAKKVVVVRPWKPILKKARRYGELFSLHRSKRLRPDESQKDQ